MNDIRPLAFAIFIALMYGGYFIQGAVRTAGKDISAAIERNAK